MEQKDQSKISSFFGTPVTKRSADTAGLNEETPPAKIPRSDQQSSNSPDAPTSPLSPEQKAKIEEKRQAAKSKLLDKKGPRNFGLSWKKALACEFDKEYFQKLSKFVDGERQKKTIYPPEKDVFSWTLHCDIQDIKVVVIGQDPYHGPRQAHGLCFSVQPGVAKPPSLVNIFKELKSDVDGFKTPDHGYLVGWAKQGVLLLNACLTVVGSQANSHKNKGWEQFTDAVSRWINKNLSGVVFMLWGAYAQKKCNFIDKNKHCILKAVHPSPLSAHRGFLGCKHFTKANDYLSEHKKTPIDWNNLPITDKATHV